MGFTHSFPDHPSHAYHVIFPNQATHLHRNASSLVIAEHNGEAVTPLTYNTISAAKQIGGEITALVAGPDCTKVTLHNG